MMQNAASFRSLVRLSKACEHRGLWHRSATAMSTKEDGGKTPSRAANPVEPCEAFRDDMGKSYGDAYSTRCLDEGYGERYGEVAAKVVLEKKQSTTELKKGAPDKRDQNEDTHTN